jgi:hypothetical protein
MYNLYAKKREKPNYEYITTFEDVKQKFYLVDELDRSIYQEAIVVSERGCELYVEFPETKVLRRSNGRKIVKNN